MYLGIDSGSTTTKLALIDDAGQLIAHRVAPTGIDAPQTAHRLWLEIRTQTGLTPADPPPAIATGYARRSISLARKTVTEITCHARGVHHLLPDLREIIDIGGHPPP